MLDTYLLIYSGYNWPATLSFYLLEMFTKKDCFIEPFTKNQTSYLSEFAVQNITCSLKTEQEVRLFSKIRLITIYKLFINLKYFQICTGLGGSCMITFDAFYLLTGISLAIGVVWCLVYHRVLKYLQSLPFTAWTLNFEKEETQIHF